MSTRREKKKINKIKRTQPHYAHSRGFAPVDGELRGSTTTSEFGDKRENGVDGDVICDGGADGGVAAPA
jgi:hypothetical protein